MESPGHRQRRTAQRNGGVALAVGMLLMLRNRPQTNEDEHPMIPHYHVESSNLHEQLEAAEQQAYDHDMDHMNDDIRRHLNDEIDRIIESFEQLDHSNSDDNPEFYDQDVETTDAFYRNSQNYSQDSSGDYIDENTDTEDGEKDLNDLLRSNVKLIAFLTRQSTTIRRLRSTITRLGNLVSTLDNDD